MKDTTPMTISYLNSTRLLILHRNTSPLMIMLSSMTMQQLTPNATTHTKCPDGSLSARNMLKCTSKLDKNWLVEINEKNPDGKLVYTSDGKIQKKRVQMEGAKFADGSPQSLYFEDDHPLSLQRHDCHSSGMQIT